MLHSARGEAGPVALRLLNRIEQLPAWLFSRGIRPLSVEEQAVRERLAKRPAAALPFGPAPKEVAFEPQELVGLLEERMHVEHRKPVAARCFLVAEQLLLAELSQPRLWRAARRPLLWVTSLLDRRLVAAPVLPSGVWVFELYVCRVP